MKTLIIYHQVKTGIDCADGISAAWVANKWAENQRDTIEVIGWCYQSGEPEVSNHDRIIVVDFSFPAAVLDEWQSQGKEVIVIDHHKTAMQMLEGLSERVTKRFDMDECGATLAWKHFFPDRLMPEFLSYVRDRDLWHKKMPFTEEMHLTFSTLRYGLDSIEAKFSVMDQLSGCSDYDLASLSLLIGEPRLMERERQIDKIVERWDYESVAGHDDIPVVRLAPGEGRFTSDICQVMYKDLEIPEPLFVACLSDDGETWSLRSNKDLPEGGFDVGALAKSMGGGGHRNAAGFKARV